MTMGRPEGQNQESSISCNRLSLLPFMTRYISGRNSIAVLETTRSSKNVGAYRTQALRLLGKTRQRVGAQRQGSKIV